MSLHSATPVEGMSSLMFSLQALLVRHETYIADSERERKAMGAHIEMLEAEKQALEKKNASVIEENRNLLDQLEAVNSAVSESDARVVDLQATLQSTQQELQKLGQLAARTESLERQLAEFEREQVQWQSEIETKDEEGKDAMRRWQKAERTLANLQDQIERIEREAKEEKDRHGEIVERMERRHAVEKELGSAAGRLKGAAALKNGAGESQGPNVVSHFVKDILQDNANLQMGIVELREMLNNSNEEVESLRGQLQMHQPVDEEVKPPPAPAKREDLREELTRANSQELHVHHHYHAPATTPKVQPLRRPKKKRVGAFTPGTFTPPSRSGTPRSSFSYDSPTPTATILQQTAASIPQPVPIRNRWSTQSNQTYHSLLASSGPSSPQSTTNRTSSIFDRVFSDAGLDSSRPTTPDTDDPGSPVFAPMHSKRASQSLFRTHSAPVIPRGGLHPSAARPTLDAILSVEELPKLEVPDTSQDTIPEENEGEWKDDPDQTSPTAEPDSNVTSPMSDQMQNPLHDQSFYHQPPMLRRATSHESLFSVSGMDIHTLKARPSQLLAPYGGRGITSQAVTTDTTAHAARPAAISRPNANSKNMLSGMAADQRLPGSPAATASGKSPGVGKKVGGWIFGRWGGATPTPSTSSPTSTAASEDIRAKLKNRPSNTPVINPANPKPGHTIPAHTNKPPGKQDTKPSTTPSNPKPIPTTKPATNPSSNTSSHPSDPTSSTAASTPRKVKVRSPGINQDGPLYGFFSEVKTPPKEPVLRSLDAEALRNALG